MPWRQLCPYLLVMFPSLNLNSQSLDPKNISDSSSSASGRTASCCCAPLFQRRKILFSSIGIFAGTLCNIPLTGISLAAEFADMPALRGKDYGKTKMRYPDYTETESGLQYKDLRPGNGPKPKMGETVVTGMATPEVIMAAYLKHRIKPRVVPLRIIVPPELGYPENDFNKSDPRPTTFSGQRALDFVLRNQDLIDKTLLFDIELLKIILN
ncbi:Peptidyl-prolyl cis-trans isomerase FKBP19, chloroplastic [Glycine max]|nr:Peptidyl-prolyl cis-trans isomerase FKBP19, chloroplastic [Glycine max]